MHVPFVDLKTQYEPIKTELKESICSVIDSCSFVYNDNNKVFEGKVSNMLGGHHCLGCSSGTAALHLALTALDIGKGDEVIVPANSFIATALAVSYTGAKVVFADVEDNGSISFKDVLLKLTDRTKAVIPVHLYGHPVNVEELRFLLPAGVKIIEDAAQAFGALHSRYPVGAFGDITAFSFYPAKNLGTCGQGGMVATLSDTLAEKISSLINVGRGDSHYDFKYKGFNYRLDAVKAAFLSCCVDYILKWNVKRRSAASRYIINLAGECKMLLPAPDATSSYHLFVVRLPEYIDRTKLQRSLADVGIETAIHYPIPIHKTEAYKEYNHINIPNVELLSKSILSLPMHPNITFDEIDYVCEHLLNGLMNG